MDVNVSVLIDAGLSPIEAQVYLLVLKGISGGSEISELTGIDRSLVYRAVSRLEKKGYIQSTNDQYNRRFYVEDTEKILNSIEQDIAIKQKNYAEVKQLLKTFPIEIDNALIKSNVKIYRGDDSVVKVYEDRLNCGESLIREISSDTVFHFSKNTDKFWNKYISERRRKEIYLKQLVDLLDDDTKYHRTNNKQFKEVRVVPEDFIITAGINIYGTKVAFHNTSASEPIALIINDKAMAQTMKNFFDFVWNRSKLI